jgi:hypothetical protein
VKKGRLLGYYSVMKGAPPSSISPPPNIVKNSDGARRETRALIGQKYQTRHGNFTRFVKHEIQMMKCNFYFEKAAGRQV